jgi:enamine deaminase RidA (YjgF/YER057c/UK114 family)
MRIRGIHPPEWAPARGYSNGICVDDATRFVFVAGQIAWDANQNLVGAGDFPAQFEQALRNVVRVVEEAGGVAAHVVRLTIYVTDKRAYLADLAGVGAAYRGIFGDHYPAMALVQVADLLEEGALVEVEATAALP